MPGGPDRARSSHGNAAAARLALWICVSVCASGCEGPLARPDAVVLIVVDTLRADHLGTYGYRRSTSPGLDRWAERGVVFERASAPSPWTLPSFASLYTGRLPTRHGAGVKAGSGGDRRFSRLARGVPVAAEIIGSRGFATAGFATNRLVNGMWFDPPTGYRAWWSDGGDESPIAINIGDGSDPEFTERAQAVLDTVTFESVGPNPIPSEGNLWELGIPSEVPAGSVNLPVGPGVTFEMSEPHFVFQDEYLAAVELGGPGVAVIYFPDEAFDGEPLATVDDVVGSLERDPDITATIVGTREVSGYEATEVNTVSSVEPGPVRPPPNLQRSAPSDSEWLAPPDGTLWIMEPPDGLAVITAEWFEPAGMEPAQALAAEILDSIVIGS